MNLSQEIDNLIEMGLGYFGSKRFELALECFQKALQNSSVEDEKYSKILKAIDMVEERIAMFFYEEKKYDKALKYFTNDIENDLGKGRNFQTYFYRGRCYHELKMFGKAIDDYTTSIRISPSTDSVVYVNRGDAFKHLKEYDKAKDDYDTVISLCQNDYSAYNNRGNLFLVLKDYEKALSDYSKSIEIEPKYWGSYVNRGNIYRERGEYEKSINEYTKAIERNVGNKNINLYGLRGNLYSNLREYEKAITDFTKIIDLDSKNYITYRKRALTYGRMKEHKLALGDIDKAIEYNPRFHEAWNSRGTILQLMGQHETAIRAVEMAMKILGEDDEVNSTGKMVYWVSLASSYGNLGNKEKCVDCFKLAIESCTNISQITDVSERRFLLFSMFEWNLEEILNDFASSSIMKNSDLVSEVVDENENALVRTRYLLSKTLLQMRSSHLTTSQHPPKKDELYPSSRCGLFKKDNRSPVEEEMERKVFESLKLKLEILKFEDLQILRRLGKGAFGKIYTCTIPEIDGIYVLKVYHNQNLDEVSRKEMMEKDCAYLGYNRNIVSVLCHRFTENIDIRKFPDYEIWKEGCIIGDSFEGGVMLMKYYPKDLKMYTMERVKNRMQFSSIEVCYIIEGLLKGIGCLRDNYIVHRDLHPSNVFVDESYGRIYVADFGCSINVKDFPDTFKIPFDASLFKEYQSLSLCTSNFNAGGRIAYLPPEVVNARVGDVVDYTKSDLFSVGMIAYGLFDRFINEKTVDPFKEVVELSDESDELFLTDSEDYTDSRFSGDGKKRSQEKFREIDEKKSGCHPRLAKLIESMLCLDSSKRISVDGALKEVEKIELILTQNPELMGKIESEGDEVGDSDKDLLLAIEMSKKSLND